MKRAAVAILALTISSSALASTFKRGTRRPSWAQRTWLHGSGPGCGNGIVEGEETCDDGNTIAGDGCSSTCTWEVPQLGAGTLDDGNHILSNGQSLSYGANGTPALTTTQPFDGKRASGTTFPALVESTVESHVSATANQLRNLAGSGREWIGSTHGGGGTNIDPYHLPGGTNYQNAITQVTNSFNNRTLLVNDNYRVVAGVFVQGEQDVVDATPATDYLDDLLTMRASYEDDIQDITGQTEPVPWILWQVSSAQRQTSSNSADSRERSLIPDAQWSASVEQANRIFLAGPKYWVQHGTDGVHLANTGYRKMGEYTGMVADAILVNGVEWRPTSPLSIVATGSNIRACYHVPCSLMGSCGVGPVLAIDTTNVTCPEHITGDATCRYGFELLDPSPSPRYITAVAVDGNTNCVDITTNGAVRSGSYLAYAWTGVLAAHGGPGIDPLSTGAARGNLRDTNTVTGYHSGDTLYDWAVHMGPTAISGGASPSASVATLIEDQLWTWGWTGDGCPAAGQSYASASFASSPESVPYGSGAWACNTPTDTMLASAAIGSARTDEAIGQEASPGCWRTTGTGNTQWNIAANSDIHIHYVGVLGRASSNYYLTGFSGDSPTNNQFSLRADTDGTLTYVFDTDASDNGGSVAGAIPATPTWSVLDVLVEKSTGSFLSQCRVTVCINGTCTTDPANNACGATGTGNFGISSSGANCTAPNPWPWLFLGVAIGEPARNGWRLSTSDFAGEPWRMSAIDTEHASLCTAGLGSCAYDCGNGSVGTGEGCDDGDNTGGDGCSPLCVVESGWTCSGSPSSCSTVCGDGLIRGAEECDDDDTDNGDGCSSTCSIEEGCSCIGEPSVCTCFENQYSLDFGTAGVNADESITCGDIATDGISALTSSLWVRADTTWINGSRISTKAVASGFSLQGLSSGRIQLFITGSGNSWASPTSTFVADTWYHISWTYDGSQTGNSGRLRVSVDGVDLSDSGTYGGTIPATLGSNSTALTMAGLTIFFAGNIDEAAFWIGHAATASQRTELYNAGVPGDLDAYSGGSPTYWWRMGDGDTFSTILNNGTTAGTFDCSMTNMEAGDIVTDVP